MSADEQRERLRRYLEQRRELGESELLLDSLEVADVMKLVGAVGGARSKPAHPMTPLGGPPPAAAKRGDASAVADRGEALGAGGSGDWRAALRAAGAVPDAGAKQQVKPEAKPDAKPAKAVTPRRAFPPLEDPATEAAGTGDAGAPPGDAPAGIVAAATPDALIPPSIAELADLAAIAAAARSCTRCPLYATAHNAVAGEGNPNADLMIVGEAPGATEDETGRPFVGESGQLLTKIIEAINLKRDDVFIANVIKHRPPANRNPKPDEIVACSPYLLRQIELVRPKVILTVGNFAAQTLLGTKESLGKLRGQVHEYHGVPLIVTYHPAALLRNPAWKRPTWEDVQLARRVLDRATGA